MTRVKATANDGRYSLECREHANTSEVCSAISVLCYTLAGCLINNVEVHDLSYDLTPGYAKIMYESSDIRADEDFRSCVIGLLQVEQSHSDELTVIQNVF